MRQFENVFIATPTHIIKRYCANEFTDALIAHGRKARRVVICNSKADAINWYRPLLEGIDYLHLVLVDGDYYGKPDSIHRRIVASMNTARSRFLYGGTEEWFLSLESDLLLEADTIESLLDAAHMHDALVVHSNCYPGFNTATTVVETDRLTMGCTLIHRSVLEAIDFRYDPKLLAAFHDAFFAHDCKEHNFRMVYCPGIKVQHMENQLGSRGWDDIPASEKGGEM